MNLAQKNKREGMASHRYTQSNICLANIDFTGKAKSGRGGAEFVEIPRAWIQCEPYVAPD